MDAPARLVCDALGLGLDPAHLGAGHMALRACVVFTAAIAMARLGGLRFLGQHTALDVMLVVTLGSVVSRAINGQAAFFPSLAAGFVLVLLHRLLASLAARCHWISNLVKGRPVTVITDGKLDQDALRRANMSREDLLENLRLQGSIDRIEQVSSAHLERGGVISVIKRSG